MRLVITLTLAIAIGAACSTTFAGDLPNLVSSGPDAEHRAQMMDFGRLIGSWKMDISTFYPDGRAQQRLHGSWNFGWILEGRAVQDVFIINPQKKDPESGLEGSVGEYGTTVRMFVPGADDWEVTYFGPRHSMSAAFVAKRSGADVILERREPNGDLTHWVFDQIQPRHFRWRALTSTDQGNTWRVDEIMIGSR